MLLSNNHKQGKNFTLQQLIKLVGEGEKLRHNNLTKLVGGEIMPLKCI